FPYTTLFRSEGRRRDFGQRQTEDASTRFAQSRTNADRSSARLVDGRSRRSQRQSWPHSFARRNSTDGQRATDRRVVLPLIVAAYRLKHWRLHNPHYSTLPGMK